MVIKSTIPVGYTKSIREKTGSKKIMFSPESTEGFDQGRSDDINRQDREGSEA